MPPTLRLSSRRSVPGFAVTLQPNRSTNAPFLKERRTHSINATKLNSKSGGAQWRDLQFSSATSDIQQMVDTRWIGFPWISLDHDTSATHHVKPVCDRPGKVEILLYQKNGDLQPHPYLPERLFYLLHDR